VLAGFIEFCSPNCGQVIVCFCLCLSDVIVELHAMNEKNKKIDDFLFEK